MELEYLQLVIAEVLHVDRREVTMDSTFVGDLGADSLDMFQIFTRSEEKFDIKVPDEDWHAIRSVGDAVRLIRAARKTDE
jgi:acyl carrier protein